MEDQEKKCSSKEHNKIKAISFCQNCKVYLCSKCQKNHIELYNHILLNQEKYDKEIFTGLCEEENHLNQLDFHIQRTSISYKSD